MGDPIDLRSNPIFIAREIIDVPGFPGNRVVVGEEDNNCSFYTKVTIIERDPNASKEQIDTLIEDLRKTLSKA